MGRKKHHDVKVLRHPHIPRTPAITEPKKIISVGHPSNPEYILTTEEHREEHNMVSNDDVHVCYIHCSGEQFTERTGYPSILIVNSGRGSLKIRRKRIPLDTGSCINLPTNSAFTMIPNKETLFQYYRVIFKKE